MSVVKILLKKKNFSKAELFNQRTKVVPVRMNGKIKIGLPFNTALTELLAWLYGPYLVR